MNIQFDWKPSRRATIDPETFYRRINQVKPPTTSQPSVGELCELYQSLATDGSEILSIHLTSKLSGTWQSAMLAARQLAGSIKVSVVDSLNGSTGLGLLVREAAQMVEAGLAVEEIVARVEARRPQVNIFIMLKDLRYARMSGRVGRIRETLASLLNVKPIIGVEAGALIPLDRVRSRQKAFERMATLAVEGGVMRPFTWGWSCPAPPKPKPDGLVAWRLTTDMLLLICRLLAVHLAPHGGFAAYLAV
jgi:DegV family protein with EDD domain